MYVHVAYAQSQEMCTQPPHIYFTFMWPCIVTNLFFKRKPTDALISRIYFVKKLYMFQAVPLPIIWSFPPYIRHWYISYRLCSILVLLESCLQTCLTYTSAECTVQNSWRWAQELPDICRVSWQDKFGKLVCLLVLLKKKLPILIPCFKTVPNIKTTNVLRGLAPKTYVTTVCCSVSNGQTTGTALLQYDVLHPSCARILSIVCQSSDTLNPQNSTQFKRHLEATSAEESSITISCSR
jgi:hypothetical protein